MGVSLVVGATGMIGSSIMRTLGETAIPARIGWGGPNAIDDLHDSLRRLQEAAHGPTPPTIYWAAGKAVISSSEDCINAELADFRAGLRCVTEASAPSTTLVLISSAGGIHSGAQGAAAGESTPPKPLSAYGRMKLEQERLVHEMVESRGLRGIVLRAPTVYGPGQDPTKPQGLVSALIRSARTSRIVSIFVPRDARRHYLWSDDLGRIAREIVAHVPVPNGQTATRIVTTERSRTIDEVVSVVARVVRRRPVVRFMATNHAGGHGRDLTLQSEFAPVWRTSGVVGLAEGARRLADDLGWTGREVKPEPAASRTTAACP